MVNRQGNLSRGDGELEDPASKPRCVPAFARLEGNRWDCQPLPHFHEDKFNSSVSGFS